MDRTDVTGAVPDGAVGDLFGVSLVEYTGDNAPAILEALGVATGDYVARSGSKGYLISRAAMDQLLNPEPITREGTTL